MSAVSHTAPGPVIRLAGVAGRPAGSVPRLKVMVQLPPLKRGLLHRRTLGVFLRHCGDNDGVYVQDEGRSTWKQSVAGRVPRYAMVLYGSYSAGSLAESRNSWAGCVDVIVYNWHDELTPNGELRFPEASSLAAYRAARSANVAYLVIAPAGPRICVQLCKYADAVVVMLPDANEIDESIAFVKGFSQSARLGNGRIGLYAGIRVSAGLDLRLLYDLCEHTAGLWLYQVESDEDVDLVSTIMRYRCR